MRVCMRIYDQWCTRALYALCVLCMNVCHYICCIGHTTSSILFVYCIPYSFVYAMCVCVCIARALSLALFLSIVPLFSRTRLLSHSLNKNIQLYTFLHTHTMTRTQYVGGSSKCRRRRSSSNQKQQQPLLIFARVFHPVNYAYTTNQLCSYLHISFRIPPSIQFCGSARMYVCVCVRESRKWYTIEVIYENDHQLVDRNFKLTKMIYWVEIQYLSFEFFLFYHFFFKRKHE